jgi:hypothetical protein
MEARRMDGENYPPDRKSHALKGSKKDWPVGIMPEGIELSAFDTILVCEGMPDLLAAYHFIEQAMAEDARLDSAYRMLPVAILGRSNHRLHPDALARFRGKRVRIYPHADKDGGGRIAAEKWAVEFAKAGSGPVDCFRFDRLTRKDGKPVNDLNDCAVICDADKPELEGLLP